MAGEPGATITPQACSPIRTDKARVRPTITVTCRDDFSRRTLAIRRIGAPMPHADRAASSPHR